MMPKGEKMWRDVEREYMEREYKGKECIGREKLKGGEKLSQGESISRLQYQKMLLCFFLLKN